MMASDLGSGEKCVCWEPGRSHRSQGGMESAEGVSGAFQDLEGSSWQEQRASCWDRECGDLCVV